MNSKNFLMLNRKQVKDCVLAEVYFDLLLVVFVLHFISSVQELPHLDKSITRALYSSDKPTPL